MDEKQRRAKQMAFLDEFVFKGLINLNDGFDTLTIKYFSEPEFETVLTRVGELGITVHGIEPWKDGDFYDVLTDEDFPASKKKWVWKAFDKFKNDGVELQYSASYTVPDKLLETWKENTAHNNR